MRLIFFILLCLIAFRSDAGNGKHAKKNDTGSLLISFTHHTKDFTHTDSVLVIFDKYDFTGAGIVRSVFYPHHDHSVIIDSVPTGKYFVSIQYLGLHHDFNEKIVCISKKKRHAIRIRLEECNEVIPNKIKIPVTEIDLANLQITKMR